MLVSMADTIVARPGPPVAISTTTNNYPSAETPASLCPLCHRFTTDLLSFNFVKQATCFPPWFADQSPKGLLGDGFHHHGSFSDLVTSAKTCQVCAVFLDIFAPMPDSKRRGWLGLYPYCKGVRAPSGRRFVAAFSEALEDIGYDRVLRFKASPHVLSFCVRDAWGCDLGGSDELVGENGEEYNEGPGLLRAVSEGEEFETARRWLKECEGGHAECNSGGSPQLLPKRVVDVGESEADKLVLYTSEKVEARYVALSHCWGGDIPGKTIKQNITSRCTSGIPLSEIPQNFRDAVKITRELGIRYLWIDALCIIQDCPDDWAREAAKMATVYASATVMISALHSASSTDGILARPLAPLAILDSSHAIQRQLGSLADELAVCPLNSRGWCMQERLLSPRILHFGAQQMFWECCASHHCENGQRQVNMWLWDDRAARLTWWRKAVDTSNGGGERVDWALWRHVIEAYSARLLTDPLDKLPALAGAAEAFRASRGEGRYVAGAWREDLLSFLYWRPYYEHGRMRKVGGPQGLDKCAVMTEPVKRRAPSWSWAALDGRIYFQGITIPGLVILDVEMGVGDDETCEARPEGRLTVRGQMAEMFYHPSYKGYDVGDLTFGPDDSPDWRERGKILRDCLMDVNRIEARSCWIIEGSGDSFLVLKMRDDGCFSRIGYCSPCWGGNPYRELLVERTIVLV